MSKYIHYCWFGGKPLPKLAKKCIKSWKKFLPDYEIIEWNESNVDLEECPFIKEAYANKKWAFVADYARTKAMYEMGGIYFDTDMEVTKNITELLEKKESFLGVEDSHMIACGVWYEPSKKSYLSKKMLEFYRSREYFDIDNIYKISIPRIISNILTDFDSSKNEIQHLKHNITIYSRDYFYPLSYNHQYNIFTDKTCMIHYYDATWTPKHEIFVNKLIRKFGEKNGIRILNCMRRIKNMFLKILRIPAKVLKLIVKNKHKINKSYIESVNKTNKDLLELNCKSYVAFYNPDWFGVANATKELFKYSVPCKELLRKKDIEKIKSIIIEKNIKMVIFSGFCIGWKNLAKTLHNNGVICKTYFHGSHSQVLEPYGWQRNMEIYKLQKDGIITTMATCKASLVNFYKSHGCNCLLLSNKVNVKKYKKTIQSKSDEIRIGIYAAKTTEFRKNAFTALSAASLIKSKKVIVDMIPLTKNAKSYSELLKLDIDGVESSVSREELLQRMANCDIVIYTTFSECAPMMPIEAFSQNTICICGNNCHYFKNNELENYIVVNSENNPMEIANKIELCLAEKKKVLDLYKVWEKHNNDECKMLLNNFLKDGDTNEK